ncbi:hypothetical protein KJ567_04955 [Candidatus Bipolaricaulota bacterium]|nr:hypothetical protein [Candidatus Bipolaricaulota bacterium]
MFTALQRRTVWILWAFGLFGLLAIGARAETVVTPLIDRPGITVYCDAVEEAIDAAETSIVALLSTVELEDDPLVDALIAAHGRGVDVRVLIDTSDWSSDIRAKGERAVAGLQEHGIDARLDDPAVTTHAKLIVFDGETTILGSSNWNAYAFTEHEQANVRIDDPTIAAVYTEYFERIWDGRAAEGSAEVDFGEAFAAPSAIVPLPDANASALYGRLLLELLPRARTSIHVAMYRMSIYPGYPDSLSNELVDALVAAAGRGVEVKVLLDDCRYYEDSAEANLNSAIALYQRGIEVKLDGPEETMHAKLLVVDGASVVLGSTNWNYYSLEQNVEANVAFLSLPEIAAVYEAYFQLLWRNGRSLLR